MPFEQLQRILNRRDVRKALNNRAELKFRELRGSAPTDIFQVETEFDALFPLESSALERAVREANQLRAPEARQLFVAESPSELVAAFNMPNPNTRMRWCIFGTHTGPNYTLFYAGRFAFDGFFELPANLPKPKTPPPPDSLVATLSDSRFGFRSHCSDVVMLPIVTETSQLASRGIRFCLDMKLASIGSQTFDWRLNERFGQSLSSKDRELFRLSRAFPGSVDQQGRLELDLTKSPDQRDTVREAFRDMYAWRVPVLYAMWQNKTSPGS